MSGSKREEEGGSPEDACGSCLCGAVQLRARLPPKWTAHCHCSMCRRAHMAGYVTWVGFLEQNLQIEGEENLLSYASSQDAVRRFCRTCGATLLFSGKRWPGEIHVALAAFPDNVGLKPQAHAFYDRAASWIHVEDQLPKLGGQSGTEPL